MHLMERKVLELIGEDPDSPDVFTDTEAGIAPIRDSINDAIQEICMMNDIVKRNYYIPLRANQQLYRVELNYGYLGWFQDVWLINKKYRLEQTGLLRLSKYDPRWQVAASEPRAYFPIGADTIAVYPKPSASSDTLEVSIVEVPISYTDDNAKINLRSEFTYAAIEYAVSEYWASRGDAQEALVHYETYRNIMGLQDDIDSSAQSVRSYRTFKEPYPTETA